MEISFLSNPAEEERLQDDDYKMRLAEAVAVAAHDYVTRRYLLTDGVLRATLTAQDTDSGHAGRSYSDEPDKEWPPRT